MVKISKQVNIKIKFNFENSPTTQETFNSDQKLVDVFQYILNQIQSKDVESIELFSKNSEKTSYNFKDSSMIIGEISRKPFTFHVKINSTKSSDNNSIPSEFYCSISKEIIINGVKVENCQHTFESDALDGWLKTLSSSGSQPKCPECDSLVKDITPFSNEEKEIIVNFVKEKLDEATSKKYLEKIKKIKLEKMRIHKLKSKSKPLEIQSSDVNQLKSKFIKNPCVWFTENSHGFYPIPLGLTVSLNESIEKNPKDLYLKVENSTFEDSVIDLENMKIINKNPEKLHTFKVEKIILYDCVLDDSLSTYDEYTSCLIHAAQKLKINTLNLQLYNKPYMIDFTEGIKQINAMTLFSRDIVLSKKKEFNSKMDLDIELRDSPKSSPIKKVAVWKIELDKGWKNFDPKIRYFTGYIQLISAILETEYLKKKKVVKLVMYGKEYQIFFDVMKQVNLQTNFQRNVMRA
jgi:hypothetical protein